MRKSVDIIEVEGVKRALQKIESADVIIVVVDTKENFQAIFDLGMESFIKTHIKDQLEIELTVLRHLKVFI